MFHVPPFHGPKYVISCDFMPYYTMAISCDFTVFLMQAYICDAAASPLAMNNDMIVGRWASTPTGQQTGTLLVLLPTLDF